MKLHVGDFYNNVSTGWNGSNYEWDYEKQFPVLEVEEHLLRCVFYFHYTASKDLASASNQKWTLLLLLIPVVDKVDGCTPETVSPQSTDF